MRGRWALVVVGGAALLACANTNRFFDMKSADGTSVAVSSEDLRVTVVRQRTEADGTKRTVTCVEPVGPAMLLQNLNLTGAISALGNTTVNAGGNASFSTDGGIQGQGQGNAATGAMTDIRGDVALSATQSLGQIYEVGQVMQFVQTMSFRYCEAYANGTLDAEEYMQSVEDLQKRVIALMREQMYYQALGSQASTSAEQETAKASADAAKNQCKLALGTSNDADCTSLSEVETALVRAPALPEAKRQIARTAATQYETVHTRQQQLAARLAVYDSVVKQLGHETPPQATSIADLLRKRKSGGPLK